MGKLDVLKAKLAKILLSLSSIKTDKGILEYEADELRVGIDVFATDENGERKPIEDGEYTTEDGTIITVKDGKVDTIIEVVEEPTEEEPVAEEEMEEEPTEEPVEEPTTEEEEKVDEIAEIKKQIEELTAMVEDILNKIGEKVNETEERLSKIEKMTTSKPIEEEMEAVIKKSSILNDKQSKRVAEMSKNWREM
jgi:hypothetical protein